MKHVLLSLLLVGSTFNVVASAESVNNYYVPVGNVSTDAGMINQLVSALANQLTKNKDFGDIRKSTIAITSFVSLDDLQKTSKFGNIVSENLIHDMQVRGYKVIDYKTMANLKIDANGDFIFSRNIDDLKKKLNIDYVLTGTYSEYSKGTVLNARVIDLNTQVVLSSAQIFVPQRVLKSIYRHEILDFQPHTISLSK
ncbi:MAG: FlgO family outer membrane protein [Campylobacterota bacterium]|nr:FlgO family outer membrane protein [Campylobacterota bacterium]